MKKEVGDTAAAMAMVTAFGDAGVLDHGYYVILWKRQPDGAWKMHWDISSSSQAKKG